MLFTTSFIASALLALAAATDHAGEGVAASETLSVSSSASVAIASALPVVGMPGMVNTHVVQVGGPNGTLVFSPENIVAAPGDLVQFQFNPKNHSVVQSTFDQPCIPIQNIMPNKTDAFYSGFMPSNASAVAAGNRLTYTIRVMDTKPIWFYCSQGQHCQAGMVGAINAAASGNKTMGAFKALAAVATENLSPGQAAGQGGAPPAQSSGVAAGTGLGGASQTVAGGAPTAPTGTQPAQQSVNAAERVAQSAMGLGVAAFAAFWVL